MKWARKKVSTRRKIFVKVTLKYFLNSTINFRPPFDLQVTEEHSLTLYRSPRYPPDIQEFSPHCLRISEEGRLLQTIFVWEAFSESYLIGEHITLGITLGVFHSHAQDSDCHDFCSLLTQVITLRQSWFHNKFIWKAGIRVFQRSCSQTDVCFAKGWAGASGVLAPRKRLAKAFSLATN